MCNLIIFDLKQINLVVVFCCNIKIIAEKHNLPITTKFVLLRSNDASSLRSSRLDRGVGLLADLAYVMGALKVQSKLSPLYHKASADDDDDDNDDDDDDDDGYGLSC
jgi:hypothetical protein